MNANFRATARLATAALVLSLASPFASAETATSDCAGWTMTGHKVINPDGMRRYLQQNAILQRLVDGQWVDVEHDFIDCLSDATEAVLFEGTWDQELVSGDYRAIFHQDIWLGWWTDIADAQQTAATTDRWFGFDDEVGPYACEGECSGDNVAMDACWWRQNPGEWPVEELELGAEVYTKEQLLDFLGAWGCGFQIKATKELIAAKLNLLNCTNSETITNFPFCGATITDTVDWMENYLFPEQQGGCHGGGHGHGHGHGKKKGKGHGYGHGHGGGSWFAMIGYLKMAFFNRNWL